VLGLEHAFETHEPRDRRWPLSVVYGVGGRAYEGWGCYGRGAGLEAEAVVVYADEEEKAGLAERGTVLTSSRGARE
jgi:hypothetical protein